MYIVDFKKLEGNQLNPTLKAKKTTLNFSTQVVNLELKPEGVLPLHKTPVDVLFYVIKGTGVLTIGDEKQEVTEGMLIESPANIEHGWENKSDSDLSVLVTKLY